MKRTLTILCLSLLVLVFSSCKKHRENIIIGTWYRINLEAPQSKSIEVWDFTEYNDVKIRIINNYPKDTVLRDQWRYAFDSWNKIRLYKLDGSVSPVSYDIVKLNKKTLILKNYTLVSEASKEFVRDINELAIQ